MAAIRGETDAVRQRNSANNLHNLIGRRIYRLDAIAAAVGDIDRTSRAEAENGPSARSNPREIRRRPFLPPMMRVLPGGIVRPLNAYAGIVAYCRPAEIAASGCRRAIGPRMSAVSPARLSARATRRTCQIDPTRPVTSKALHSRDRWDHHLAQPVGASMDIGAWLRGLGLGQYEAMFRESEIESDVLPELTETDLEKIGLPLGPRKRILKAIANLGGAEKASGEGSSSAPPPS